MKVTLDNNIIQCMSLFNSLTKCSIIDCIEDDGELYFVVGEGQYGLAVGKGGATVKKAERIFKKSIKVFEYARSPEGFVRNIVPDAQEISVTDSSVVVKVRPTDRARVIGKNGRNVHVIRMILERLFEVQEFKVK